MFKYLFSFHGFYFDFDYFCSQMKKDKVLAGIYIFLIISNFVIIDLVPNNSNQIVNRYHPYQVVK